MFTLKVRLIALKFLFKLEKIYWRKNKMEIYAISNPAFLSDTFIFKNIKDVWNCGPVDEWFYIK